jgi:hypothetical protein
MALDPNRYKPYDREYAKHDNAKQRMRMRARYAMVKKYGEAALKGKDIDHVVPLQAGGSNKPSNWRVRDIHGNRGDKKVFKLKGYRPIHLGRIK